MAAESVHTTVRLPADVADTVQSEARRLGVSKGAAMAALIRQGQSLDAERLLSELETVRYAAKTAAARAEKAQESADRAEAKAIESREAIEAIPKPPEPPEPAQYTGQAVAWFGAMKVTLSPVKPQKQKTASEGAGAKPQQRRRSS